ncbi:MAG: NADP-dependent isocitrate dehydrogenase [Pirellulaceae bacterium]|nr:NADP-dependent isocitrate dehydrogenase [Pirellulaceae bacterium]
MPKKIVYTFTDEAPALATRSLLPILRVFTQPVNIELVERDISLACRILANFADFLAVDQRQPDWLKELGELVKSPDANIIKLPNISASLPQLKEAIAELQSQGYAIPGYPESPDDDRQREIQMRYSRIQGSAVNPVIREGNSDRRVAAPVKEYARQHPHKMGVWRSDSATHVASMSHGDFYGSETSCTIEADESLRVVLITQDGTQQILKSGIQVQAGDVVDGSFLSLKCLRAFYAEQYEAARRQGQLVSLHLKATMMKVSDPVMFGHAVSVFMAPVFEKHATTFAELGVDANQGLATLADRLQTLPAPQQAEIRADIAAQFASGPALAMVNSDQGITNLHAPNDVIIDASMAAAIRDGGKMWGADGRLHDTKMIIPDRSYAGFYQAVIDFCKSHGAFDPRTMGNVSNVGLMAQKAEEYGSHDKTFILPTAGRVRVVDKQGRTLLEHELEAGDIWRMCCTSDEAIRDWVRLAVQRAKVTGLPAVFWLDSNRAHDRQLIAKVDAYLAEYDLQDLDIQILPPPAAAQHACWRAKEGLDTISVTGNVLRDFLTDLFPILELGTSAKMLSIVPLLAGGSLYETGAGGSAPKHVEQFIAEGHLRWDSIGEFLAVGASLEDLGQQSGELEIQVLGETLNQAIGAILDYEKSPQRSVRQLDTRGSHFYLALYWAQALAKQDSAPRLQEMFAPLAQQLANHEKRIIEEIDATQGEAIDLGGYYHTCVEKATCAMRPSATFNRILDQTYQSLRASDRQSAGRGSH